MLFMVMHKVTEDLEKGVPPTPALLENMGKLVGEAQRNGTFLDGAGLKSSATRVRLECSGGKCTVTRGPSPGPNELLASFVILKVPAMEEALTWATRIGEAMGDVEIDVGPVVEPWDLGFVPKPANPPLRVMILTKASAASEAGAPLPAATTAKLHALVASMKQAGLLLSTETLLPSSRGARLHNSAGKRVWTDGPFTETKEMISGFSILRLGSLLEARAWTERYADVLGDIVVDVREVVEAP
jgi:hypothetical protein